MNRAFIFDMDGVIADSERIWVPYEEELLRKLVGKSIAERLTNTTGLSIKTIYDEAKKLGYKGDYKGFFDTYDFYAKKVYKEAKLTPDVDNLIDFLKVQRFEIGLVSSSSEDWINSLLKRTNFINAFKRIISLGDHPELRAKPHPDGYIKIIEILGANSEETIVLEDSNYGIEAGKKSGAFVIGFTANLQEGYQQRGADLYAKTMLEVILLVKERIQRWEHL